MKNNLKITLLFIAAMLILPMQATTAYRDSASVIADKMEETPVLYYCYRVTFKDKKNNSYSLKRPEEFLSTKALERRKRHKIKVDNHDLPVSSQRGIGAYL